MTYSVLIAEDEDFLLEVYNEVFSGAGFQVTSTIDGNKAASLIHEQVFDALVLDIHLPSKNGLQIAAIARSSKKNRKAPIFIVSGNIKEESIVRAEKIGVAKLLTKPVETKKLVKLVEEAIEAKPKKFSYDVKFINAVVGAAKEVFEFYLHVPPALGKPHVKPADQPPLGVVTSIISLTGNGFGGSMALTVNKPFMKLLYESIFQGAPVEASPELITDLAGEMANQLLGKVKMNLGKIGVPAIIGLPKVVVGEKTIQHHAASPVLEVPFSDGGDIKGAIEFCLEARDVTVGDQGSAQQTDKKVELF